MDTNAALSLGRYTREIELLEQLSKQGESYANAEGRFGWRNPVRSDTGPLLTSLVAEANPLRVLEIGTGHGLSTLYLAEGLQREDAELHSLEFDAAVASSSQDLFNRCGAPVKVFAGDALQTIPTLPGGYDVVFFDAQKDQYYAQLAALLNHRLLSSSCLILADNVTDRKAECQSFLDFMMANTADCEVRPTECGLLVATLH